MISIDQQMILLFNMMSVSGKYRLVGSANISNLMYNSDYDLNEFESNKSFKSIYQIFKNKFIQAKKDKLTYITDFKCGEIHGEPLRWDYDDIIKGFKQIETYKISFEDAIKTKGLIKLDVISIVSGKFLEFSEIYYLKINNVKYYENIDKVSIKRELKQAVIEEEKLGNYMKCLKRIFSIAILDNNKKIVDQLIEYFNGPVGFINKQLSDLKNIKIVMEQKFRKAKMVDIISNLQSIKQNLSFYNKFALPSQISTDIDKICELKTKTKTKLLILKHIIVNLDELINKNSFDYFNKISQ